MTYSQEHRNAVGMLGRLWPKNWSADRTDAYLNHLAKWSPKTIARAIDELAEQWRGMEAPPVAYIADGCRDIDAPPPTPEEPKPARKVNPACGDEENWHRFNGFTHCSAHNVSWRTT